MISGVIVLALGGAFAVGRGFFIDLFSHERSPLTHVFEFTPALMDSHDAVAGDCWGLSVATSRPSAFRCSGGHTIHDPCFRANVVGPGDYVLCPGDPRFPADDVLLRVDLTEVERLLRALHATATPSASDLKGQAWFFTAENGLACNRSTGTMAVSALGILPFDCGAVACDIPEGSGDTLMTECVNVTRTAERQTYMVTNIWY